MNTNYFTLWVVVGGISLSAYLENFSTYIQHNLHKNFFGEGMRWEIYISFLSS